MNNTTIIVRNSYTSISGEERLQVVRNNIVRLLARKSLEETRGKYNNDNDAVKADTLSIS